MSTTDVMNGDRRKQLERRAEAVRSRLEQRLDLIDHRAHRLVNVARAATSQPAAVALLAVAGIAATILVVRGARRRNVGPGQRLGSALQPLFGRYAGPAVPRAEGFFVRALKRAAISLVAVAVQRLGTQGMDRLLAGAPSSPAAAPPRPGVSESGSV